MAQQVIHRPARVRRPDPEPAPIELHPAPSRVGRSGNQSAAQLLMPLLGGAGSMVMIVTNRNPIMLIAGGIMLAATVLGGLVMFGLQRTGAARHRDDQRQRYLFYLDSVRSQLATAAVGQRDKALLQHPAPADLIEVARSATRIWERRRTDPDFLTIRVGTGAGPLWQQVVAAHRTDPLIEPEVVISAGIHRLLHRDRLVHGMPVTVPISGRVSIVGPAEHVRSTVVVLLAQIATLHSPDDVRLFVCTARHAAQWLDWLKWLPHVLSPTAADGNAPLRQVLDTPDDLRALVADEVHRRVDLVSRCLGGRGGPARLGPALVLVVDQHRGPPTDPLPVLPPTLHPAQLGIHVITLAYAADREPADLDVRVRCGEVIEVEDHRAAKELAVRYPDADQGAPDLMNASELRALARELTAIRLVEEQLAFAPPGSSGPFNAVLGLTDVGALEPSHSWAARSPADFLRVPLGISPAGEAVQLDLKEPALGGMGPHGLCIGATGSGKSEVLRTVVLGQSIAHSPERLALVLVDYKGGATFAGLEALPHCAAMVTNLSDADGMVERLYDALFGELTRRQRVLADAGNLPHITEYNRRRDLRGGLPPLPNLLVVIDEFGELLTAKPEFIELFLAIGRIGRSIGVHLLLASQRLEEGRLRGLESFLSYRIGLRTLNAGESRTVLGVPDAYELPPNPGSGYLKVDNSLFQRFQAAYSGAYVPPAGSPGELQAEPLVAPFPLFNDIGAGWQKRFSPPESQVVDDDVAIRSVSDIAVTRLAAAGQRTAQIWLPPLPAVLRLDEITGEPRPDSFVDFGLDPTAAQPDSGGGQSVDGVGRLAVPVGLLDRPSDQRQDPLVVDLAAAGGHLAVLGAPQTGKSTFLRTLVISACRQFRPGEIAVYCIDFGATLGPLADLPHVAGLASRRQPERVRRCVAEVRGMLDERETLLTANGIDSVEMMRQRYRDGRLAGLAVADVLLVIDGYTMVKTEFEELAEALTDIAGRGPGCGIHLVLTAARWSDLRIALQAAIGTKIEFRLNDPGESAFSRKAAANLAAGARGRCLADSGLQAQICLPELRVDASAAAPMETLIRRIAESWPGSAVPHLRTLPSMIAQDDLSSAAGPRDGLAIAIGEADLQPVEWPCFGTEPHLLVVGDTESGKTALLRAIIADLVRRRSDAEVVFAVFDVRRTLLDFVPDSHLGAYAGTADSANGVATAIAAELAKRLPPDTVTAAQLRSRSWWTGPEIFVLVDDYDLFTTGGTATPLAPLIQFLAQARDIGFHLAVARRSGGAGRAMHEPLIQRMRESGAMALLLSGDRQEGALFPGAVMCTQPPGRGILVRRGRHPTVVQVGFRGDEPIGAERPGALVGSMDG